MYKIVDVDNDLDIYCKGRGVKGEEDIKKEEQLEEENKVEPQIINVEEKTNDDEIL